MASLMYSALLSLDGYVADEHGRWDWAVPDEEVHAFVNDLQGRVGTHLYGRRMYEVLQVWETMLDEPQPDVIADYARVWQTADKIVYSRTLEQVTTARTRLERRFDPGSVRAMKASEEGDLVIGGPELASQAFAAGIVDEVHLFLAPAIVGGGTRALPDDVRLDLELVDERRFASGMLYVGYRVT